MTAPLLPHVPLGGLFGLIEVMAETPGPDDLYRLAERLRLRLDDLHPLLEAARLLGVGPRGARGLRRNRRGAARRNGWRRGAQSPVPPARAATFRSSPRFSRALAAAGETVDRARRSWQGCACSYPPLEAERQVDTAVNWGHWADLFDYDADDARFLPFATIERPGGRDRELIHRSASAQVEVVKSEVGRRTQTAVSPGGDDTGQGRRHEHRATHGRRRDDLVGDG